MKRVSLLLLLCLVGCEKHPSLPLQPSLSTAKPVPGAKQAVILLMGQSNMLGAGMMPEEFANDPNVGIDNKRQGPGYIAGSLLVQKLGPVQLFQCAVGGSQMDKWKPGGDLYQGCLTWAVSHIGANQYLAGVFFDQGEAEATGAYGVGYPWAQNFTAMIRDLRTHYPDVPVVYVQLGPNTLTPGDVPEWQYIQDQQASVNVSRCSMVNTNGLGVVGEHYTKDGYVELGRRIAQAFGGL